MKMMNLYELREIAKGQQEHIETQQRLIMAKEQRLKYLKEQSTKHDINNDDKKRLLLKETINAQDYQLRKMNHLQQQTLHLHNLNINSNKELESIRAIFNEKEKELSVALAKVDALTRQLEELKNGNTTNSYHINGLNNTTGGKYQIELEKLRQELLYRTQMNERQMNEVKQQGLMINEKKSQLYNIDEKVNELQQRLAKKRLINQQLSSQMLQTRLQQEKNNLEQQQQHQQHQQMKQQNLPQHQYTNSYTLTRDINGNSKNLLYPINSNLTIKRSSFNKLSNNLRPLNINNIAAVEPLQRNQHQTNIDANINSNNHNNSSNCVNDNNENKSNIDENNTVDTIDYRTSQIISTNFNKSFERLIQTNKVEKVSDDKNENENENDERCKIKEKEYEKYEDDYNYNEEKKANIENEKEREKKNESENKFDSNKEDYLTTSLNKRNTIQTLSYTSLINKINEKTVNTNALLSSSKIATSSSSPQLLTPPISSSSSSSLPSDKTVIVTAISNTNPNYSSTSSTSSSSSSSSSTTYDWEKVKRRPVIGDNEMEEELLDNNTKHRILINPLENNNKLDVNNSCDKNLITHHQQQQQKQQQQYNNTQNKIIDFLVNKENIINNNEITKYEENDDNVNDDKNDEIRLPKKKRFNKIDDDLNKYESNSCTISSLINTFENNFNENNVKFNSKHKLNDKESDLNVCNDDKEDKNDNIENVKNYCHILNNYNYDKNRFYENCVNEEKTNFSSSMNDINYNKQEDTNHDKQDNNENIVNEDDDNDEDDKRSDDFKYTRRKKKEELSKTRLKPITPLTSYTYFPSSCSSLSSSSSSKDQTKTIGETKQKLTLSKTNVFNTNSTTQKTKSNLKSKYCLNNDNNNKMNDGKSLSRRVSFDPLALLLDAALEGELELVRKTTPLVSNPSKANDEGITALHNAICAKHFDIVKYLVEIGCDVNLPDSDGWTPLHCAASCNSLSLVKFLVEHGACIFSVTISDHETAAEKCEEDEDGFDECSQYLYGIQENLGILNGGVVYAVYDYDAQNSDELSFNDGDRIIVLQKGDEQEKEWWWSKIKDKEGYVPRNLLGLYPRIKISSKDQYNTYSNITITNNISIINNNSNGNHIKKE